MHIYKVSILFDSDLEDCETQWKIDECLKNFLSDLNHVEVVSSEIEDLSYSSNIGRCKQCGTWTSDYSRPYPIREFSNGTQIQGEWFCDVCIPRKTEASF